MTSGKNKLLIAFLLVFLWLCSKVPWCRAQAFENEQRKANADSTTDALWSDETYYRINLLRLRRYVVTQQDELNDTALNQEIAKLLREADGLATAGDYEMANIWMDTVWELLTTPDDSVASRISTAFELDDEVEGLPSSAPQSSVTWSKELLSGVDLWRQKFNLTLLESDSTVLEGTGNPFTGARLNFSYQPNSRVAWQGRGYIKYSRDYISGEASLKYRGDFSKSLRLNLENRFEGTSYHGGFDLKFFQNYSALGVRFSSGPFSFDLEDELLVRKYAEIDSSYPNYFHNTLGGSLRIGLGTGSLFSAGYRNVQRVHREFEINDYSEHRIEASWLQSLGPKLQFSLQNDLRFRDYKNVPTDHFFQDYWENYFLAEVDIGMTDRVSFKTGGAFIRREYQFHSINSLPDDQYWELEPQFYLKISDSWKIGSGFHYAQQTHEMLNFNSPLSATDRTAAFSIPFEDYREYGPLITLDFFQINGILFSIRESYLLRRYPNATTTDVNQFNLYTDRNINSLLLFLTWPLTRHWHLNILANMDDDRSRKDTSGDSQNALVDVELSYVF